MVTCALAFLKEMEVIASKRSDTAVPKVLQTFCYQKMAKTRAGFGLLRRKLGLLVVVPPIFTVAYPYVPLQWFM